MKICRKYAPFFRPLLIAAFALAATACAREDMSDCKVVYLIRPVSYGADNEKLDNTECRDVLLYVFNSDNRFVREIETSAGELVEIEARRSDNIYIVGWGNVQDGSVHRCALAADDHISGGFVQLTRRGSETPQIYNSPADLFHGTVAAADEDINTEKELPVYRKTGTMAITLRKIKEYTESEDDDYRVVVRETRASYDFDGELQGDKIAAYQPDGALRVVAGSSKVEYFVPAFNMAPDSDGVTIDIYHAGVLIRTVTMYYPVPGEAAQPVTVEAGRLTNVLIDFGSSLGVSVEMSQWGEYHKWKEFDN